MPRRHQRGRFGRHLPSGVIVALTLASVHSQSSERRVRPPTISRFVWQGKPLIARTS
jgi:hypothetical protein